MEYAYLGYTEARQIVKGTISALDERAASDLLVNSGYRVISLKPVARFMPDLGRFLQRKVKPTEMVTFSRQLALLLESGVGIIQSLEMLQAQTTDKSLRGVLIEVVNDLRGGKPVSVALGKHPRVFSTLYCKLVAVGEQTGSLETVLRSLADYTERQTAAMAKVKQALTYPIIVFCLAIVVAAIMMTVLLPPLVGLFAKMGGQLPITTRLLIAAVDFFGHYGLYLLVAIIGLVVAGLVLARTPNGRYYRDWLILRIPVVGRLIQVSELARACRSLSLLFRAGLPLPEIMTLTGQASGNLVISRAFGGVEQGMLRGQGLSGPMDSARVFLPLMVQMTKVGEETGNLDNTLMIVAENYEIEADRRTQTLLGMIEPIMTIAIGIGVGFLALSVFMPLYGALKLVG